MSKRYIIVTLIIAILGLVFINTARAEDKLGACRQEANLKAVGWSAVYGGTVLGLGAAISVAISPVSIPLGVGAAIIASNGVVSGLIGAGSSITTRISDGVHFGEDLILAACQTKVTPAEKLMNDLRRFGGKAASKTGEVVGEAYNNSKEAVKETYTTSKETIKGFLN